MSVHSFESMHCCVVVYNTTQADSSGGEFSINVSCVLVVASLDEQSWKTEAVNDTLEAKSRQN